MKNSYLQTPEEILKEFKVSLDTGLSAKEVLAQRETFGPNELKSKKGTSPIIIFLRQFKSFIIYILLFAVTVSFLSGEKSDGIVILFILIFNATVGFIQEYKAEKSIEELKKLTSLKAKVLREGQIHSVDTIDLVPGDILMIEAGDKVPADARIIECNYLEILESTLTGESVPVSKKVEVLIGELALGDQKNMIFAGTIVTQGSGTAIVVNTGMQTEIGKIADLLSEIVSFETPLQKKLQSFGKWIGVFTIFVCIIVFATEVFENNLFSLLTEGRYLDFIYESKDFFLIAVALAVAAVPEGLPAIVTVTLALGVRRMAKRHALVRRLPFVETLGETSVICSDKTGTLTKNEMTVRKIWIDGKNISVLGEGYSLTGSLEFEKTSWAPQNEFEVKLFEIGTLCNNGSIAQKSKDDKDVEVVGDPTETALLISGYKAGCSFFNIKKNWKKISEKPFDSQRKMMSTVHENIQTKESFVMSKGAPESIMDICTQIYLDGKLQPLTEVMKKEIMDQNRTYAESALRVLGFAYKKYLEGSELEENLIFVGLQGMIDPPRPEVKIAIQECYDAGIKIKIITGDNKHTAAAIGKEIGIEGETMDGIDFAKLSLKEQQEKIHTVSIFSRVEPEHKMLIVHLLQENGEIVAMTGDGVNDAPAIKQANIGISMGIKGTDVTKEASDMILQDDNFATIVHAIEEGRGIYENIKKFVNYLLSSNIAEVLIIFFALILKLPLPMTAIMLLWLNLVTDGLPALALSIDPHSPNIMKKPPQKAGKSIMDKKMKIQIFYVSFCIVAGVLGLMYWALGFYAGTDLIIQKVQTLAFTALIALEFVRLQAIRSEYHESLMSNKYLLGSLALSFILQLIVIYSPLQQFFGTVALNFYDWGMIIGVAALVYLANTIGKKLLMKFT